MTLAEPRTMAPDTPPPTSIPLELFRQVVDQADLAISITDPQARILYANPAFERVTGYAGAEVVGKNESILSYRVTPRRVYQALWDQLQQQRHWSGLLVNRRRDGGRYLADLSITPVQGADGRTSHFLGMHRDVTEVHRLERQVQNQKRCLESVVDAAQVAIVMLDTEERVVLDNQEYKKFIGDLGLEPARTLLTALRALPEIDLETAREKGRNLTIPELALNRTNGRRCWFSCSLSWIEEQDGDAEAFYAPRQSHFLLLTFQEITALKEQQEAIRLGSLRALLAERERIQSLREALSGALFQLQGPFNLLATAVRMLERRSSGTSNDPNEVLLVCLQEALWSGQQALETLQAFIPAEASEAKAAVDLNEVLHDVLRMATPNLLAEGVVVEWQPEAELPSIPGRQHQLMALFKQLLDNALEAIHEARPRRREIRLAATTRGDHLEVAITDSGPGIPEAWRLKAFEPFFTTKGADEQHMGMGLTMAQEVVSGHGGLIAIDPDHHSGCRMVVQFPLG